MPNQFDQSMINKNDSLVDLLHCQQQTQNDTAHALQATQQSQRDHATDLLIDDIQSYDVKPELYFDWILKL